MANGEIVAVGILGVLVSLIYFCFWLSLNLGKDSKDIPIEERNLFLEHYPLRYFLLMFGFFLMYITMWQAY
jgi:hypothetical protein